MAEKIIVLRVENVTVEAKAYRTNKVRLGVGAEAEMHSNGRVVYTFAPESAPTIAVKVEADGDGNIIIADLTRKLQEMAHEGVGVACAEAQCQALEAERERERREKEEKEKKDAEIKEKFHRNVGGKLAVAKEREDEGI